MSSSLILIVLTAAFLHAFWNALVKGSGDKTIVLGLIALGHVVPGVAITVLAPLPGWDALPYIIASTLLHWGYYYFLNLAYQKGDLSLVYPITRGLAPVMVALGAQIWIGESLPVLAWLGILAVSAGVMVLSQGIFKTAVPKTSIVAAVIVATLVASYSLVDGIGVRLSDSIMGYIGWLFTAEACVALFILKPAGRGCDCCRSKLACLVSLAGSFRPLLTRWCFTSRPKPLWAWSRPCVKHP